MNARSFFSKNLKEQSRLILVTVAIGLAAGLAAMAFRAAADAITRFFITSRTEGSLTEFALLVFPTMVLGALVAGWLMYRFAPDAGGSGIPQVKLSYHRNENNFSLHLIWVKFVAGVLAIGTGSSLGREGPTIHIGAAIASWFSRWSGESREARANAVCAGSAAGLAAAFNSPLSGVTLVLEEIAGGKNENKFAGRALLTAAIAVSVIHLFAGDAKALPVDGPLAPTPRCYWLTIPVALFAGLMGLAFQKATLSLRGICKTSKLPVYLRTAAGAGVAFLFAFGAFAFTGNTGVFGLGETQLIPGLNGQLLWQAAAVLAACKLAATVLCYGTGAVGGIFAPILFFGGMTGAAFAGFLAPMLDLTDSERILLAVTGISAALSAVVRAPLTSILIVLEMTREIYAAPLLMIAAVVGVYLNRFAFRDGFYDAALRQDGTMWEEEEKSSQPSDNRKR